MSIHDGYALDIRWDVPDLPRLVGPFITRYDAERWARLNIPNGTWEVAHLAWPHAIPAPARDESGQA